MNCDRTMQVGVWARLPIEKNWLSFGVPGIQGICKTLRKKEKRQGYRNGIHAITSTEGCKADLEI